ncbi:MAG TPA: IS91 family transposase [Polyangiales bacterium]|nr:IS91 family transposase [Polyangiales bacterium]
MHPHGAVLPLAGEGRPRLEVAEIFRAHGEVYRQTHVISAEQRAAMRAIEVCRTAALGGHVDVCDACAFARPAYNSCRNRHCPKCQSLTQAAWIEKRMECVLPTHYFHVVFTLPHELGALALRNRKQIFNLLFSAAAHTLLELGRDEQRLGAQLGVTTVLHTWTRDLRFHPHVHCIVTGGGLAPYGDRWVPSRQKYLFPVRVLSNLFRGKFLDGLAHAFEHDELDLGGTCAVYANSENFNHLKDTLYRKNWVVYAKRPFAGPEQVFKYLGRYTHRVGISNQRLVSSDDHSVCFRTKNGKQVTVVPSEFIRRFLLHVLPNGFVKIRHYGLHASSNVHTKLVEARRHLEANERSVVASPPQLTWKERLLGLTGLDLEQCPRCGGQMISQAFDNRLSSAAPLSPTIRDSS